MKKRRRSAKTKTVAMIKILTWVVVVHGLLCITTSYIMAWCGIADTLENLSSVLASEVVAPIVVYGLTKMIENIFEKNITTFSKPLDDREI